MHVASSAMSTPVTRARPRGRARVAIVVALGMAVSMPIVAARSAYAAGTEDGPNPGPTSPAPSPGASPTTPGASVTTSPYQPGPAPAGATTPYESAKAHIAAKEWKAAITVLSTLTVAEPGNADAWNLLGYATRKNGDPKAAVPLYAKALVLNPRHRGALEYQGEAYVELRQLTRARANLAALKRICGTTCEEYRDLAAMIRTATTKKK